MTDYTNRFKFPIPDFAIRPWHAALLTTFARVDEAIFQALINAGMVPWTNGAAFESGQVAVDTDTGTFWICLVSHTAAASGTFADDRDANPTYWGLSTTAPESRGAWTTATAYANTDFVSYNNGFYVCVITHTSTTFEADLAEGKWDTLVDLAPIIASIESSLQGIEEFSVIYLGVKAADPTLDNDGNALINGALYFNSVSSELKVYNSPSWVAISASAPNTADYLVKTANGSLSAERVVTDSAVAGQVKWNWSVAGEVKALLYASAADKLIYTTGADAWAETNLSAFARSLIDDTTAAAARATLGAAAVSGDTFTGTITTAGSTGAIAQVSGNARLSVRSASAGDAAYAEFHRPGAFAGYIGIDTDNVWKVGGYSHGAASYRIRHAGNMGAGISETFGDIWSYRATPAQGILYLGNTGATYVYGDGSNIHLFVPGNAYVNGSVIYHTGNLPASQPPIAGSGISVASYTVSINTANYGGVGSYSYASVGGSFPPNATGALSLLGGTWRNMSDYDPLNRDGYALFIRVA